MKYKLRFVPIGGIVGVTKNMYLYELYTDGKLSDILIVDCGIGFPEEQDLGVDFEIPDISYLEDKKDKIRGLVLTHGHYDHMAAVRFHYEKLGRPKMYASKLTAILTQNQAKESGVTLDIEEIKFRKTYNIGPFDVRFIRMTHSIPDTTHVFIKTPAGNIYHGSDFKMDLTPPYGPAPDFHEITNAGEEGIMCLLSDSLGSDREGYTPSESTVGETFEKEIRSTKGKFIMTTFASNISRVRQCAEAALKFNRKICLMGRSMVNNVDLVQDIGYFPIDKKHLISEKQVKNMKPQHVCIIATGSQGQFRAATTRLADGTHHHVSIEDGDKVLFSSDPIPGNEEQVYGLIEDLLEQGAEVRYSDVHDKLHTSGHGSQGDMLLLMRMVNAKYLVPIGGTVLFQRHYRDLARRMQYNDKDVYMLKEGETVEFQDGKASKGKSVKTNSVFVDSYGVGDVGKEILRDRQTLATEGMVVMIIKKDKENKLVDEPVCIARGFIYGKEDKADKLYNGAIQLVKKSYGSKKPPRKRDLIRDLERYFRKKSGKTPLVVVEMLNV